MPDPQRKQTACRRQQTAPLVLALAGPGSRVLRPGRRTFAPGGPPACAANPPNRLLNRVLLQVSPEPRNRSGAKRRQPSRQASLDALEPAVDARGPTSGARMAAGGDSGQLVGRKHPLLEALYGSLSGMAFGDLPPSLSSGASTRCVFVCAQLAQFLANSN